MSTSPTSAHVLNHLNTPSNISEKKVPQEPEKLGLFVPDEARLSLESLKQSNNDVKRFIRQFTRYGDDFREELEESLSLLEQQEQNSVSHIMKQNFGITRPEVLYLIYQSLEPQYSRDQLRMVYNILAREGYTEVVRKKSFKEVEELFNQIYNIVRDRLRHYLNSRLPLPDTIIQDGKVQIKGDLTPMESIHKKKILNLLDRLAAIARDFAMHLTLYNPRMKDMRGLIERFARQLSQGYMTCFYAGMRQGVSRKDLVGEGKPLSSTWVTREDLEKQYQQFKDDIRKLPRYGAGLTTVSKVLDSEIDYKQIDRGQDMINQIRSWERDPAYMSDEELEHMDTDEIVMRKILAQNQPSEAITSTYTTQVAKEISREKRWKGTQLHRTTPALLGLPMYNTIKDMVENPKRYDILGNGWLIATEVRVFEDNRYGEIDLLILKFVEMEYEDGFYDVPYVMAVLDRKSESYIEYNITPEYRPSRLEKRKPDMLRQNLENPDPSNIALRLLYEQDKLPDEIKEKVLHTTMTRSSRTHRQVELYSKMAIRALNSYKRKKLHLKNEIFEQKDCILGAIKVDSLYQSAQGLEELAVQEWKLWTSALHQLELDPDTYANSLGRHRVTHPDLPDVGLVLSLGDLKSPILEDATRFKAYHIDPFAESMHATSRKKSTRKTPDDKTGSVKIHLHYPVKGRHHSNEFVSEMSSLHYLLENHTIIGSTLVLDVSAFLKEFAIERIVGLSKANNNLLKKLHGSKVISTDLAESSVIDIPRRYDNVIVWGLQELAKECQGKNYHQRVIGYRRKILDALKDICSDIYLIDRVVKDARQVISHGQAALLPYQPKKYLGDVLHLTHLASISYNLPRAPTSILSHYDTDDEVRHIMTFTPGQSKPTHETYICSRFAGESRSWDYVDAHRRESLLYGDLTVTENEVEELHQFFPWSSTRKNITHQLWDDLVEIESISCLPECRKSWDHTKISSGLATVVFNPLRDLSSRLKNGYPLLTGLLRGFRPYRVKKQAAPQIRPKEVSTKTPYISIFQRDGSTNPLLMATKKNPELIDIELNWMTKIHKWLSKIVPRGDTDISQSRLYELVQGFRPHLDPKGCLMKTKELIQMLQPLIDLECFDPTFPRDRSYEEKESMIIGMANTITVMGGTQTIKALMTIRRYIPREILTYLNLDPLSGRSLPTNWLEKLRIGNWLVLLFAMAFQIARVFNSTSVVHLLSRQIGWIMVQLKSARNPAQRLAKFTYRMYPERVLYTILEHIKLENRQLQELVDETGMLIEDIRAVRVCQHQKTQVLSIKDSTTVRIYFLERDYRGFGPGEIFMFDHDYRGAENLQQDHKDLELYCITWFGKEYLYKRTEHALQSIAQMSIFEERDRRLVFLNYTNAPSIPLDTYTLPTFDHGKIKLPEYSRVQEVLPILTMNQNWEFEVRYIKPDDHEEVYSTFSSYMIEHIFDDVLELCETPQKIEYDGETLRIFSPRIRIQPGVTEDQFDNVMKMEMILEQLTEGLFHYKVQFQRSNPEDQYLMDSYDVQTLYENPIRDHHVAITIGFDEDRAIRSAGNMVQEASSSTPQRIRHTDTYYIEMDNPDFRPVARRLLGVELKEGKTYLPTWDIYRLTVNQVIFDPEDISDRWNIEVKLPFDTDDMVKITDDVNMRRLVNSRKPGSHLKRTVPGSFDKQVRYEVLEYEIKEREYQITLRYRGVNLKKPYKLTFATECEFIVNLEAMLSDMETLAEIPLKAIDQSTEMFQDFKRDVQVRVVDHNSSCTQC